jgi:hypothetical protein
VELHCTGEDLSSKVKGATGKSLKAVNTPPVKLLGKVPSVNKGVNDDTTTLPSTKKKVPANSLRKSVSGEAESDQLTPENSDVPEADTAPPGTSKRSIADQAQPKFQLKKAGTEQGEGAAELELGTGPTISPDMTMDSAPMNLNSMNSIPMNTAPATATETSAVSEVSPQTATPQQPIMDPNAQLQLVAGQAAEKGSSQLSTAVETQEQFKNSTQEQAVTFAKNIPGVDDSQVQTVPSSAQEVAQLAQSGRAFPVPSVNGANGSNTTPEIPIPTGSFANGNASLMPVEVPVPSPPGFPSPSSVPVKEFVTPEDPIQKGQTFKGVIMGSKNATADQAAATVDSNDFVKKGKSYGAMVPGGDKFVSKSSAIKTADQFKNFDFDAFGK